MGGVSRWRVRDGGVPLPQANAGGYCPWGHLSSCTHSPAVIHKPTLGKGPPGGHGVGRVAGDTEAGACSCPCPAQRLSRSVQAADNAACGPATPRLKAEAVRSAPEIQCACTPSLNPPARTTGSHSGGTGTGKGKDSLRLLEGSVPPLELSLQLYQERRKEGILGKMGSVAGTIVTMGQVGAGESLCSCARV